MLNIFTKCLLLLVIGTVLSLPSVAQKDSVTATKTTSKHWYETINLRGYVQARYNRLLETNPDLKCEQCDRSWGDGGSFYLRRVRLVFSGQISKQVYFYIQPDFASSASATGLHFGQIRDAYFDIGVDKNNEYRFRIGQSKVPFGFDNIQSSQIRLAFDRDDALNSAMPNERDLGVFFYWAPKKIRERFSMLVKDGLKGSGDYGVFGVGLFNGQTANRPEGNKNLHKVIRVCYPFQIGSQIIEPGLQAYTGLYNMPKDLLSSGVKTIKDLNYMDERVAASFVLYPKPFGVQAEYNVGRGPEFNPVTDSIETQNLQGGYITLSYSTKYKQHILIPFARVQYYDGGKKLERDARSYTVKELELGVEWQPVKTFELTAAYTFSNRRFEDFLLQSNTQKGSLLRLQAQINF